MEPAVSIVDAQRRNVERLNYDQIDVRRTVLIILDSRLVTMPGHQPAGCPLMRIIRGQ